LGSLLYVVNSGLNRNVRLVSSVSGGSIVNAVLALGGDFSEVEPERFGSVASRLARRMARKGVFFWPGLMRVALVALVSTALLAAAFSYVSLDANQPWTAIWSSTLASAAVVCFYAVVVIGSMVLGRSDIQRAAYTRFFAYVLGAPFPYVLGVPWYVGKAIRNLRLGDLPHSGVSHVLCATELTSGQPFYMSRDMVFSPRYGRGEPNLRLEEAVYASAAFPIGFPPLRVKRKRLRLAGGVDDEVPKTLLLADGGVFNNLGTDAFSADMAPDRIYLPDPDLAILPTIDQQLVVNASALPKKVEIRNWPGWRSVAAAFRTMSILYENTLSPRVQNLLEHQGQPGDPVVLDISESPVRLIDRLASRCAEMDGTRQRALRMRGDLAREMSETQWDAYAEKAARTKTVLSSVGRTAAVRLVRLGYLNMAIACHTYFNTGGIQTVPSDRWFQAFVDGTLSPEQLAKPIQGRIEPSSAALEQTSGG
jgi:predicted acylesterase/phospholipase RssA